MGGQVEGAGAGALSALSPHVLGAAGSFTIHG